MSVPIRDRICGCTIATRGNRYDRKPWWTWYGYDHVTTKQTCPKHFLVQHKLEIMNLFHKVIGHLVWKEGHWSTYITIEKHRNRNAFWLKDVYCNECGKWHYK